MSGALQGLTVIAVEQAVAAPLASARLADAGARVIKVERPEGDFARRYDDLVQGESAYFVWLNRGKESICLDLKHKEDQALLTAMIAAADVFIQNLKPGVMTKLGFGAETLRARHPRLITCDISGFGSGPCETLKAYDLIVQAESGLCAVTGTDGPTRAGVSVCDIGAGLNAYAAILEAIIRRGATGTGSAVHVSLFDSIAEWMNVPLLQFRYGGHVVERSGVSHPTIAPYSAFRCADGAEIILAVQNEREWVVLCSQVLEMPELAADPRYTSNVLRVRNRLSLDGAIAERIGKMPGGALIARLEAAGIAYGRLNPLAEAARHPHLRFLQVATDGGDVDVIAPPGQRAAGRKVPRLDEHGASLRREFGRG